jgi:hypothetical protein
VGEFRETFEANGQLKSKLIDLENRYEKLKKQLIEN